MELRHPADVAIPELAGLQRRFLLAGAAGAAVSMVTTRPTEFALTLPAASVAIAAMV
jgi:hypothetical protein